MANEITTSGVHFPNEYVGNVFKQTNSQNENTMCTDHCLKHLFRWGSGERLALNGKASPTTRLEIFPVNDFADCRTLHRGNGNGDNYTMPYKLYF
mgnify:FL=1